MVKEKTGSEYYFFITCEENERVFRSIAEQAIGILSSPSRSAEIIGLDSVLYSQVWGERIHQDDEFELRWGDCAEYIVDWTGNPAEYCFGFLNNHEFELSKLKDILNKVLLPVLNQVAYASGFSGIKSSGMVEYRATYTTVEYRSTRHMFDVPE